MIEAPIKAFVVPESLGNLGTSSKNNPTSQTGNLGTSSKNRGIDPAFIPESEDEFIARLRDPA
jgi:hypothetical protein